uniref:Uncharacterized protein n=1 Tax=Arundo donax TaxID=35708 RepID=A0A0A9HXN1_ARUDO
MARRGARRRRLVVEHGSVLEHGGGGASWSTATVARHGAQRRPRAWHVVEHGGVLMRP